MHQWKPENNGPLLLQVAILVQLNYQKVMLPTDGQDGSGLQLEKFGPTFSSCTVVS